MEGLLPSDIWTSWLTPLPAAPKTVIWWPSKCCWISAYRFPDILGDLFCGPLHVLINLGWKGPVVYVRHADSAWEIVVGLFEFDQETNARRDSCAIEGASAGGLQKILRSDLRSPMPAIHLVTYLVSIAQRLDHHVAQRNLTSKRKTPSPACFDGLFEAEHRDLLCDEVVARGQQYCGRVPGSSITGFLRTRI